MSNIAEEFEKRQNIKAKTVTTINTGTRDIERLAEKIQPVIAGGYFSKFGNTLKEIEQEEFERWKRKEQNAVYGLDTGEGGDQSVNYYQVINDNPNLTKSSANNGNYGTPNYTTVKIDLPKRYLNISEDLDSVLESSDLMKELNELCIRDTTELYVRELLNRIDRCCRWLEANKCYEIDCNIPIAILKNNVSYIKERYDLICDIRSWDNYYVKDGEDVLAEILGVKDE